MINVGNTGPIETSGPPSPKALFANAVWGAEYVERFLNYSLRTQLSDGNLGTFNSDSLFLLVTDRNSIDRITSSPIYQALADQVSVECCDIGKIESSDENKYSLLTACQNYALSRAYEFDIVFFGYGDALWADGSYRATLQRLTEGYDAVFSFGYPVLDSPFKAIVDEMSTDRPAIAIQPRAFAQNVYRHLHPMAHANRWNSQWMSHCPSYLVWNVPEQGLLLRAFHMHPVALKVRANSPPFMMPFSNTLDEEYVARLYRANARMYVARNSDEIGVCSLAEDTGQAYRMLPLRRVNIGDLACFAERYAGLSHRELFRHSIRLKIEDPIESRWRAAEQEAAAIEKEVSQRLAIPDSVLALEHPEAFAARADRQAKSLHLLRGSSAQHEAESFLISIRGPVIRLDRAKHSLMGRLRTIPRRTLVGAVKLLHRLGITKTIRLWVLPLLPKAAQLRAHNWVYRLGQRTSVGALPLLVVQSHSGPWLRFARWIRKMLGYSVHE